MGLKGLMYRNLVDMQKEYIESLLEQLRHKNEFIIKETKRAIQLQFLLHQVFSAYYN